MLCGVWCVVCVVCCDSSKRFMVTPIVYPRVFENLTTLTFGALRTNHNVSPTFEDIQKTHKTETKKTRHPRAVSNCIMNRPEHNRSSERDVAWKKKIRRPWRYHEKKTISVIVDKLHRWKFMSIRFKLIQKKRPVSITAITV